MLVYINTIDDPLLAHLKDDPVRPDIPATFRVDTNRFVMALVDQQVRSVVCVSLQNSIPAGVDDLGYAGNNIDTAIFYTIWSYAPGAGTELLLSAVSDIRKNYPAVERFVTLSPKTEMARKFHIKNGAIVYRENTDTINYEYLIGQV
jgi:hypothetical protein